MMTTCRRVNVEIQRYGQCTLDDTTTTMMMTMNEGNEISVSTICMYRGLLSISLYVVGVCL